ncbi:MAG: PAS domain-containing protein, partial [Bryobacterales bacterium]|nr:PAS domain-containing protein [Bryobacterales bacterium]
MRLLRCGALLLASASLLAAQPAPVPKRVLLFQDDAARPFSIELLHAIQSVLREQLPNEVEFMVETARLAADTVWLLPKYQHRSVDLLISVDAGPLLAALEFRRRTNPQTTILFAHGPEEEASLPLPIPHSVRLKVLVDWNMGLRLALTLFPQTTTVALVGGGSAYDVTQNRSRVKSILQIAPRMEIVELFGISLPVIVARARELPPHAIAIMGAVDTDSEGRILTRASLAKHLSPALNVPLFDNWSMSFGHGPLGGLLTSPDAFGRRLAQVAVALMGGQAPEAFPVIPFAPALLRFDARQLQRWKVDESLLPPGSAIEFREPNFLERYRTWLQLAAGAAATLIAIVLYLLVDRWRRVQRHSEYVQKAGFDAILGQTLLSLTRPASTSQDSSIQEMLDSLRQHLGADITALMVTHAAGQRLITQSFRSPPRQPLTGPQDYPYLSGEMQAGRTVLVKNISQLPPAAALDRATIEKLGVASFCAVPLSVPGDSTGVMVIGQRQPRDWSGEPVQQIRQLGEAVVSAWSHGLAAGETLSESILGSFEGYVLAIDRAGTVLHANNPSSWAGSPASPLQPAQPGQPYADIWSELAPAPAEVLDSVRSVLSGARPAADEEVRYESPEGERWVQVHVQPLQHPQGGAVVTHLDITQRKRADLAGAQDLNRIAHLNRVSALGELAASLAHEVNQPLSAIVTNAAVAQAMLTAGPGVDAAAVQTVLSDVQNDGQRAAAVIREMRGLLKKNADRTPSAPLDVTEVTRDTMRLIAADASRRLVRLEQDYSEGQGVLAAIHRTQLQQVILNL